MPNENADCLINHENNCPYVKKPCEEVDHDVCVAVSDAYSDGYQAGWMSAFPKE